MDEVLVGLDHQGPAGLALRHLVQAVELRAREVLAEALEDVQAVHVHHAGCVGDLEELQEFFGIRKRPQLIQKLAHGGFPSSGFSG